MHEVADAHVLESILSKNDHLAEHNREHFDAMGVLAINLMSAPGAGKTTLLESTVDQLGPENCFVIEGDMVGDFDAERIRKHGVGVHQISTGRSCHLDAQMVSRALHAIPKDLPRFVLIENVGNLVCPADFQLGEHKRIVLLSVTEGADKPLKYPVIFRNCDAVIFTKCDLLPHVNFDLAEATRFILNINPDARVFAVSTKTGEGLFDWVEWVRSQCA